MKTLLVILLIMFSTLASASVSLQDCLDDASLQGDSKTPLQPLPECAVLIKAEPSHINFTSGDGKWKAFGTHQMMYLDNLDAEGNLVERFLLAGSETELVSIKKIFIDTVYKKLFVTQLKNDQYELLVYNLLFIGNVSPKKVMRSSEFNNVTSVKMENATQIEVINTSGSFLVNADGESREELSTQKAIVFSNKYIFKN